MRGSLVVARITFDLGQDKGSIEAGLARGVEVGSLALQSPLYQELEVKAGVDAVVADSRALEAGTEALTAAAAAHRC